MQVSLRVGFACTWRPGDDPLHRSGDGRSIGLDMMRPEDPSMDEAPGTANREDEIRAATIGEPWRADGPIYLADYDPEWPALYEREAARVRAILGDRSACSSMPARPPSRGCRPSRSSTCSSPFRTRPTSPPTSRRWKPRGYVLRIREPDWFEHRLFKGPDTDINLHTFSDGSPGDRPDARLPRPPAHPRRRAEPLRGDEARAGRPRTGPTSRTTPTPRARSSKASSRAPSPIATTRRPR